MLFMNNSIINGQHTYKINANTKLSQVSHNPILIDGNPDFLSQASVESWLGNGSSTNPIIISNLELNT